MRKVLLYSCFLWLIACTDEPQSMPLEEEQLVAILTDMHLAESILQSVPTTERDSLGQLYYGIIYRTHGVTAEEFNESMDVLREDPTRLEAVYAKIVDGMATTEAENQAKISNGELERDSIRNASTPQ